MPKEQSGKKNVMIQEAIAQLVEGQTPDGDSAYQVMKEIMGGEATQAQIAGYLVALRFVGETADVIAGSARAMREACTPIATTAVDVVDTCGTGGDGAQTFNISTAAALVTAGAGVPVAKHGNKSVSSKSGSADVLTALGVNIQVSPEVMTQCLNTIGIAFLFAPSLHPAMKHAIGPRRELGLRTLFNILGPLTNPASAQRGVLGVFNADLVPLVAQAAAENGAEHLFVVHGDDGLDEITTTSSSHIAEVKQGKVTTRSFHPDELGVPVASIEDLKGGGPEE
ncbi:MAG: anthranilate phosphoribosyltransferase, partial [Methylococcales bacterium]|nr:anthranilate phosphoribosyltransferase [Methylococcales bacterium]